jgi:hypothetical protein
MHKSKFNPCENDMFMCTLDDLNVFFICVNQSVSSHDEYLRAGLPEVRHY